jgi:hypothetical protein
MRNRSSLAAGIFLLAATFSLQGRNLINIDFGAHANPVFSIKTGLAATGLTESDYWNLYSRDGPGGTFLDNSQLLNLRLSDGAVTETDLFVRNAGGAWYTLNSDPMFESYLYPLGGDPNIDLLLTNVPAGTYDIYVYAHGQPAGENAVIQIQNGSLFSSKSTSAASNWDAPGWNEGGEYVVFRNIPLEPDRSLAITSRPGISGKAVINGIQLIEAIRSEVVITQQPQDQNVVLSGHAEFSVSAASELPLSFQWYFNGSAIVGSTSPVLSLEGVTAARAGAYRVSVSNSERTLSSSNAFLRIYTPVSEPLLNIDFGAHLNPFLRRKTGPAAVGKNSTDQWNLYSRDGTNGVWLDNNHLNNLVWSDGAPSAIDLSVTNAAGAWYTLNSDPMFESYLYPGTSMRNIGVLLSDLPAGTYDIYFYAHGQIPSENPSIELFTDSVNYGTQATSGSSGWDSANWSEGNHYVLFRDVTVRDGENLNVLSRPGQGTLAVVNGMQLVKKQTGSNSEITISQYPQDQNVVSTGRAEFTVNAASDLPITYQWHFKGNAIAGATNQVLVIENATTMNAGAYRVSVSNAERTLSSSNAFLRIYTPVSEPLLNIDFGAHLNPFLRRKTGPAAVGKGLSDQWNLYSRDGAYEVWLDNNQLNNLVWSDGSPSATDLSVTNAAGAWYTLNSDPMFESYLYPRSRSGNIGAVLSDLPAGKYDVYFYAHGQIPGENALVELSTDSANYGSKATSADSGWDSPNWMEGNQYVVFRDVTVLGGEKLRVLSGPGLSGLAVVNGMQLVKKQTGSNSEITITQHPQDQNVVSTGRAEFSVNAVSGLPITYQWHFNGNAIVGASNDVLIIENVSATNAGAYRVSISNVERTLSSSNAFLRIYTPVSEPLLNIDFGAHLNPFLRRKTGPAAVGKTSTDQWNLYSRDGTNGVWLDNNQLNNLVWSDGSASPTDLSVTNAAGAWYTLNSDPMFESYLYPGSRSGNIGAVLTDLSAGKYDVYFYAHGQVPGENASIELSTDSANYGSKATRADSGWDGPNWMEGNQYVVFRDVTVQSGEKLRVLSNPGQDGLAVVNGMQLVKKQTGSNESEIRIHRAPANQYIPLGSRAELSVEASSVLPLTYKWFFQGIEIPGEIRPILAIENIEAADSGLYSVRIANGAQTIERNARLDVFVQVDRPLLNIDFGAHKNPVFKTKAGPAAVGHDPADRWNLYSRDDENGGWISNGQLSNLAWNDGGSSTIHLSVTNAAGAWYTLNADAMFESYLYPISRTGNIEASLARLPVGAYDVYIYAHGQVPEENGVIALRTDSVDYGIKTNSSAADWDSSGWREGDEYVVFTNVRIRTGDVLRATSRPGNSGLSVINGMQLVMKDGAPGQYNATVADWTFEEGTPGELVRSVQDFSGSSNHIMRVVGETAAYVPTAGASGAVSVHFPLANGGFSSGLRSADSTEFNLGSEYTVEVSVKPWINTADHNQGILLAQSANSGAVVYGFDYRSADRRIRFVLVDSEFRADWVEARLPNDGKSHHVAGIYNNGLIELYVDKVLIHSKVSNLVPAANPGDAVRVTLGANDAGGFWFHGTLDRARISRQALSSAELFAHDSNPNPPLTILQPLENLTVGVGSNATFRVVAAGATNLSYRWKFNGQTLSNQVSDMLILQNVREADAGTYTVTVFSGPWEVSSSATLTVIGTGLGAPIITAHPQSRLGGLGLSAQFNVSASSSTPITYQWFFNGGPIAGETNATLWILDIVQEDAGAYHVVVSNSSGSVVSHPAILNVFSSSETGGTVYLDNHRPGVNAPVTDDRGLRVTGPEFLAQLYGAPSGRSLVPVGAAIPFGTGENAGYFSDPFERVVPGTSPGAEAILEVRAWDARGGRTFDEAAANGALHGVSNPMLTVLGGGPALPAVLTQLQPFSLGSRPRITRQPADVSAKSGRTAVFEVEAAGTGPLAYQWKFNTNSILAGQTASTLVLSNIAEINAGTYSVEIRNHLGLVTSTAARLTVLPRDSEAPLVTLATPAPGATTSSRVTLSGTVRDNNSLTRVEWLRDGQLVGPVTVSNGVFTVANVLLSPGTNQFTVAAYDDEGNIGSASVVVLFEAQRALWVGSVPAVQEGARVSIPIALNSSGDIGALSFSLSYDTNHLGEPSLDWRTGDGNSFTQVNTDQPGFIRGTYVLPGRTIRSGTNTLATVTFRTRSVPETLSTPLGLEVQGVYTASGDPIASGTSVNSGQLEILRRQIVADNNANDRLDVGDATAIIRMLTLLDPIRPWDVTGNDLNQNSLIDPGDAVRVLRAVVNLDPQPAVPGQGAVQAQAVAAAEPYISLSAQTRRLVSGERIAVRVNLGAQFPITGTSFQVNYPTNALRLENSLSHIVGPIVPPSAMTLWNLSSEQDYDRQEGQLNFAASAATSWQQNAGVLAELTFKVQPGTDAQRFWPITVTRSEIAVGTEINSSASFELLMEGRDPQPATLTAGTFSAATGSFELRLGGDPGTTYRIEVSEDLQTWTPISVITADAGIIRVTDNPSSPVAHRFYRAQEVP